MADHVSDPETSLLKRWAKRKQATQVSQTSIAPSSSHPPARTTESLRTDPPEAPSEELLPEEPVGVPGDTLSDVSSASMSGDVPQAPVNRLAGDPADDVPVELLENDPAEPEVLLTDADMPELDTLDASSDYSPFFNDGVSKELRQLALKRLFALPKFNIRDGLNDYDEDYTYFEPLGDTVTSDMKFHAARKEKDRLEKLAEEEANKLTVDGEERDGTDTDTDTDTEEAQLESGTSDEVRADVDEDAGSDPDLESADDMSSDPDEVLEPLRIELDGEALEYGTVKQGQEHMRLDEGDQTNREKPDPDGSVQDESSSYKTGTTRLPPA